MQWHNFYIVAVVFIAIGLPGCTMEADDEALLTSNNKNGGAISYRQLADTVHVVLEVDRTVYTKLIINRLTVKEKVIKASEQWEEDKALVLPAQMFRASAEMIMDKNAGFSFALISSWPLNHKNRPRTEMEKQGLKFIEDNLGENFYGEETLGGIRYFTAIYPDVAIAEACVTCHNDHKDTPRTDFKVGDVMGGVIIRIPKS